MGSYSVICGGMGQDARFQGQTATILKVRNDGYQVIGSIRPKSSDQTMPFMIGSSAIGVDNTLMVVGGGATCFSMGTYWETSVYMIKIPKSISETVPLPENKQGHSPANVDLAINFVESHRIVSGGGSNSGDFQTLTRGASVATIPRVRLRAPGDFENILRERKPVIIEGLSSGSCLQKWSPEFMAEQVGHETEASPTLMTETSRSCELTKARLLYTNATRMRSGWISIQRTSVMLQSHLAESWRKYRWGRGCIYGLFPETSLLSYQPN